MFSLLINFRPATSTEEYSVPDSMVGLSECFDYGINVMQWHCKWSLEMQMKYKWSLVYCWVYHHLALFVNYSISQDSGLLFWEHNLMYLFLSCHYRVEIDVGFFLCLLMVTTLVILPLLLSLSFSFSLFPPFIFFSCLVLVIGRGGEQINKIQQDSGCKVQIAAGKNDVLEVVRGGCAEQATMDVLCLCFQTVEACPSEVCLSQAPLTPYSKCVCGWVGGAEFSCSSFFFFFLQRIYSKLYGGCLCTNALWCYFLNVCVYAFVWDFCESHPAYATSSGLVTCADDLLFFIQGKPRCSWMRLCHVAGALPHPPSKTPLTARTAQCRRWWSPPAKLDSSSARGERPLNSYRYKQKGRTKTWQSEWGGWMYTCWAV